MVIPTINSTSVNPFCSFIIRIFIIIKSINTYIDYSNLRYNYFYTIFYIIVKAKYYHFLWKYGIIRIIIFK